MILPIDTSWALRRTAGSQYWVLTAGLRQGGEFFRYLGIRRVVTRNCSLLVHYSLTIGLLTAEEAKFYLCNVLLGNLT